MGHLPTPPDAYWENVPWAAWLGFLLLTTIICVIIGPWLLQRARNRPSAILSREQTFSAIQVALEAERVAFLADVRADARQTRIDLSRERSEWAIERDALKADVENGWDRGRGMEDQAHLYRHECVSIAVRFNALHRILGDVLSERMELERAKAIYAEISQVKDPPPVTPLRDVARVKPPSKKEQAK